MFLTTWTGSCKGTRAPSALYARAGYDLVQESRPRVYLKVLQPELVAAARTETTRQRQAGGGGSDSDESDDSDELGESDGS